MANLAGSIVAFEGHQEIISTQLRLLPTSSQILILPSIQSYLPADCLENEPSLPTFISKVHDAANTRHQSARQFLQHSTPASKRLVFMNGGTSSAQALCIRAIMKKETDGDAVEAEAIFNDLTQDGVDGLEARGREFKRRRLGFQDTQESDDSEDPITKAMRAADALDRLTANLQPSNELDLTMMPAQPRRSSLPVYGYSDSFCDAAPFFLFGGSTDARQSVFSVTHYDRPLDTPSCISIAPPEKSPSCAGDAHCSLLPTPSTPGAGTPWAEAFRDSINVEFGQAEVLDVRAASLKGHVPKVKSVDRIYPSSPKRRDSALALNLDTDFLSSLKDITTLSISSEPLPLSSSDNMEVPRKVAVGPRPTVSVTPVPEEKKRKPVRLSSCTDRGTEAENVEQQAPFKPVLPVTENLVVYFKDQVPDILLDSVISNLRDDEYRSGTPVRKSYNESFPETPISETRSFSVYQPSVNSLAPTDDYDPFAYTTGLAPWMPKRTPKPAPSVAAERPPTPDKTPRASMSNEGETLHVLNVAASQTAVAVQNSLRSILNVYFPPQSFGYHHFHFSVLPELEGLWKPVFRDADPSSPRGNYKKMDQILAIGSQRGVGKELSSVTTARLEKLGVQSNGQNRSGKLDFRYLLANAMQAFTAQPLANQTCDNPFANPYLLATLIIPRLESYLAMHPTVRFLLLDYPPEHLPTVLALQKLVGVDIMKVAQIMDSNNKAAGPFTHISGASVGSSAAQQSTVSPAPSYSSDVTVSRANFLLTSTASDSDIETLVATVRRILTSVSPYYRKAEAPIKIAPKVEKPLPKRPKPPALQATTFSPYPKTGRQSPSSPPSAGRSYNLDSPESISSVSETVQTPRSAKSRAGPRWHHHGADDFSVYTFDPAEDDFDVEERRLMPMFMQKPPKGNSRKALKFLGLA